MSSTGWLNGNGLKLCTCRNRLADLYPPKTPAKTGSYCSACGGKLTYERCTTCNGTGDGTCVICHGIIPHGCFACGGTGFASTHNCPKASKSSVKGAPISFEPSIKPVAQPTIFEPSIKPINEHIIEPLPLITQCSACDGTGKTFNPVLGSSIDCVMCKGTGWRNQEGGITGDRGDSGGGWAWLIGGLVLLGLLFA